MSYLEVEWVELKGFDIGGQMTCDKDLCLLKTERRGESEWGFELVGSRQCRIS